MKKGIDVTLGNKMKSPLRYPGGKTRACKKLEEILLRFTDLKKYDTLVSPFFGGGSFEFYLQERYGLNLLANDKFEPLYNFWQQAKERNEELCSEISKRLPVSKEQFYKYQRELVSETLIPLEQATNYFIINRCSFNGSALSGGFSEEASKKRFTKTSIDRIAKLDLRQVTFSNLDFTDFLQNRERSPTSLLFLDPPYHLESGSRLYGKNGDLHEDFDDKGLFDVLTRSSSDWFLTYNDCPYVRELYKDYTIISLEWSYGMNKTKKSSEIIVLNFH